MKKIILTLLLVSSLSITYVTAQTCQDASVELTAFVQAVPPVITLTWRPNATTTQYHVSRKLKTASSWGSVIATLPGDASHFIDSTVQRAVNYEYRVQRQTASFTGYGYINAGIEIPAVENRGIIILAVDGTVADSLVFEIDRLIHDFEGDGWIVRRINVDRDATAVATKNLIKSVYSESTTTTKALLLLGHVRVPYSGELNPDGHPDHLGAWPADTYYGEMNGTWTDALVNSTIANDERNRNTPGDGKFDQSIIPSDIELQVGRVDFFNMPSFAASEIQLLRNYLNKNHAYRHKQYTTVDRAIVDDNFGYFGGEAFASTGWKNFGPLVGFQNVIEADYFPSLADSIHQWSYGCGGGWYQGAGGVGSTTDFANGNTKSVFTLLFGSYHGDWDTQDNFLRAPLAQGLTLTNAWSGRPHWILHHMGLGENIGYSARLTMNNNNTYYASYGARFIHLGLMGDPTLRNDVVAPVSNVTAIREGENVRLTWNKSPDFGVRYNVLIKYEDDPEFYIVETNHPDTSFLYDGCFQDSGKYAFMIKARKLEVTPSGSYYNLSQGMTDEVIHPGTPDIFTEASFQLNGNEASFSIDTTNATEWMWYLNHPDDTISAERNPVYVYEPGQYYNVYLFAYNACYVDTIYFLIDLTTGLENITDDAAIRLSPNPSTGKFLIQHESVQVSKMDVQIFSSDGRKLLIKTLNHNEGEIDLSGYPQGLYTLLIDADGVLTRKRVVLQ